MKHIIMFLCAACFPLSYLFGQGITIQSGAQIVVSGNGAIVIHNGSFTNNGNFNSGLGTVYMTGTTASSNATIGGSSVLSFRNIVINKSANGVQLAANLSLFGNLQMQSGPINLNGKNISLFNTSMILDETDVNRIWGDSGQVVLTTNLNAPSDVNPGNLGLRMSSSDNLGTFTLSRIHQAPSINGSTGINRQYQVNYFNTGFSVDYTFEYFHAELNGVNEAWLEPWSYDANWSQSYGAVVDTQLNTIQVIGLSDTDTLWAFSTGQLQVTPKIMLEGNYSAGTGLMTDLLRSQALLPTTEPYTGLGYTHINSGGETVDPTIFNVTGSNAIVDWIFLEVRNPLDSTNVIQTVVGLLQADGDIVDLDGVSPIQIPNLSNDDYYLAIYHRNHLPVRTATKLALTPDNTNYDFTTALTQAWNNPAIPSNEAMEVSGSTYLLHRCNGNGDRFVNIVDYILARSNTTPNQSSIYSTYDINLDGNANILDAILPRSESTPNKTAHID